MASSLSSTDWNGYADTDGGLDAAVRGVQPCDWSRQLDTQPLDWWVQLPEAGMFLQSGEALRRTGLLLETRDDRQVHGNNATMDRWLPPLGEEESQPAFCEWCEMWLRSPTQACDHRLGKKHRIGVSRALKDGISAPAAATGL